MSDTLRTDALHYHEFPKPGKIEVALTKPTETARDLTLAYSPGVAAPVREIAQDPASAYRYTAKGNLVAVITDGTAVLGLGNVGPLAGKPVMEGKGVLFKKFADIDVFDIEVNAESPQAFIDTVARISPTFGGINLEDIKAPECFEIEQALVNQLDIPVFHDDQHGTAIIIAAALSNALEMVGKKLEDARIVTLGAGAAGIASMRLLVTMGAKKKNIYMVDRAGVVHSQRTDLNAYKFAFANETHRRSLADALDGADVFIGLSGPDLMSADMLKSMNADPIVFALSNPDPEIKPEVARAARADVIMATGRSDYPNQVNNVLCFPYLFRGALDVRARVINEEMKIAAVHAIRELAKEPVPAEVVAAYPEVKSLEFGRENLIPKPMDPRLRERVSVAVAKAAIKTGAARLPYPAHYPA
ncbi:MAG: malate dehydrogenase [Gammaproteobacteria bacterium]|nr:malate dehydrogenase [Gammaproteobacteria bacterium]